MCYGKRAIVRNCAVLMLTVPSISASQLAGRTVTDNNSQGISQKVILQAIINIVIDYNVNDWGARRWTEVNIHWVMTSDKRPWCLYTYLGKSVETAWGNTERSGALESTIPFETLGTITPSSDCFRHNQPRLPSARSHMYIPEDTISPGKFSQEWINGWNCQSDSLRGQSYRYAMKMPKKSSESKASSIKKMVGYLWSTGVRTAQNDYGVVWAGHLCILPVFVILLSSKSAITSSAFSYVDSRLRGVFLTSCLLLGVLVSLTWSSSPSLSNGVADDDAGSSRESRPELLEVWGDGSWPSWDFDLGWRCSSFLSGIYVRLWITARGKWHDGFAYRKPDHIRQ